MAFPQRRLAVASIASQRWMDTMARQVNDADFDAEVLGAQEPVLVDFWAEWCPPCKAMDPIMDELSVELAGKVKIVKLDVETNPSTASRYNVRAMPTMIVFQNGEPVDMKVGAGQSRVQLVKWLDRFAA
jgi:thioredoxin 1